LADFEQNPILYSMTTKMISIYQPHREPMHLRHCIHVMQRIRMNTQIDFRLFAVNHSSSHQIGCDMCDIAPLTLITALKIQDYDNGIE
jgi:hypothetical protein